MYEVANCTVSILRGTSVNQWGDTVDNSTVAASGIPALILVTTETTTDPSTQAPRTVQTVHGVVNSNVDVRDTDQILDETHSVTYAVESVTQPLATGFTPDLELELRRVTS